MDATMQPGEAQGKPLEGTLTITCAWCSAQLGRKPCEAEADGGTTHTICGPCAENILVRAVGGEG